MSMRVLKNIGVCIKKENVGGLHVLKSEIMRLRLF